MQRGAWLLELAVAKLANACGILSGLVVVGMALCIVWDVLARYLANRPTIWAVQLSEYAMGFVTFVGAVYTLAEGGHVSVDFVTERMKGRPRRTLAVASALVSLAFLVVLAWQAWVMWWDAYESRAVSWGLFSVPLIIPYSLFVVGMVLLVVVQLCRTATLIVRLRPTGSEGLVVPLSPVMATSPPNPEDEVVTKGGPQSQMQPDGGRIVAMHRDR